MTEDRRLEARCNAIAASSPDAGRRRAETARWCASGARARLDVNELIDAAKPFGVSVESFLRRLATLDRVPMSAVHGVP